MGILDDTSLDERARPIITKKRPTPTLALLERATRFEEAPSPAMLEDAAHWLEITDELAAAGFAPGDVLRVCLRVDKSTFGVFGPDANTLEHLFSCVDGVAIARALCEELVARTVDPDDDWSQQVANAALGCLARDRAIPPRFDVLFNWESLEPSQLRAIIASLPEERRDRLVLPLAVPTQRPGMNAARNAAYKLDKLLWILDLVPAVRDQLPGLVAAAKGDDQLPRLKKELTANVPRTIEARPTREARDALAYWSQRLTKADRAGEINSLAPSLATRAITVDAPELATVATWAAAGAKRQKQIALAVAKALAAHAGTPAKVLDIASFGGPPIATIGLGKRRFCLVPGGTFEMGFSEEEEAAVRASSEVNAGCGNHFELYEQLFEQVSMMRPVTDVRVGPLLVEQGCGQTFELAEATDALAESPFRVPSEAEWEYCARGGTLRELTYRGDVVPDHAAWFVETTKLGVKTANHFGLWGFGLEPELCADAWFETLDDIPRDATPRPGDGPRAVRGGAAQLYPWQETGEWHMLLSAFRLPSTAWEFTVALRFVLGIAIPAT